MLGICWDEVPTSWLWYILCLLVSRSTEDPVLSAQAFGKKTAPVLLHGFDLCGAADTYATRKSQSCIVPMNKQ